MEFVCDNCKKIFFRKKKRSKENNFCSQKCYYKWLKTNSRPFPSTKGSLNPKYKHDINHKIFCKWCNKEFETGAYRITHGAKFCSNKCRQEWYSKEWSQTKEWSEISKVRATKILSDNLISKTNSRIQIIINKILDSLNVNYENEKNFKYFSVDNYLIDYNLCIENMGTYWHCDHRKYEKIIYSRHVDRIKKDKTKKTFLRNNCNINCLYLWETDIIDNLLLCKKLVELYIKNNGVLEDYNSFNYILVKGNLKLIKNIEKPFMDYDIIDLNKIIDIKVKQKRSMKQIDKWIIYNCEFCGKEKEELICHYNSAKHHCCSYKCACELKKKNNQLKKDATLVDK